MHDTFVHATITCCPPRWPPQDLPAEVLIAILKHVPLSQRLQSIDTVCQRLFSINRAPELWHCVNLGADPHWRGMVDYRLLNNLVYFSTGCRASLHNQVPHLCTIHTLDLRTAMCKLSAADLVKFCIRRLPSLKVLYACSVHQEHNYNPLYFHLEDMLYAAVRGVVVCGGATGCCCPTACVQ